MRIAIVGAGVSGLVAAHLLHRHHEITVYEAGSYAGGHTNTVRVDADDATHWVDTGFIVLNDRNYPNFTRLLDNLGVATQPSHMGFSVKGDHEDFEYAGTPRGLFCQASNLRRGTFWRMLADLMRFNRELRRMLAQGFEGEGHGPSLGDFLDRGGYSHGFVRRLIVPQVSAVWSADPAALWSFPVRFMAEFFANHGMLGFTDRPAWRTVAGGSRTYVDALTQPFTPRIRLRTPVVAIARDADGVEVVAGDGAGPERYDQLVLACHSDQALRMLREPSRAEEAILGAIPYQRNEAVLHTDASLLPRRAAARQSWNFHLLERPKPLATVTYWMNRLQRLRAREDYCVTLNRTEAIDPEKIIRTIAYHHPVFTPEGVRAQASHGTINGVNRTHYCGAYWGWGFHEDGVVSALRACEPFGVSL